MNLLNEVFFDELRTKRNVFLILFLILFIVFTAIYIFTFFLNTLWISLVAGIIEVIVLVLFYYGTIFDKIKLLKLYRNILTGITQEDSYFFKKTDDFTVHDGVRLLRLICTFKDDGEIFERTLYFLSDLEHPTLKEGQKIKVRTHQNIIVNIED